MLDGLQDLVGSCDDAVVFVEAGFDDGVHDIAGTDLDGGDDGLVVDEAVDDGGHGFAFIDEWEVADADGEGVDGSSEDGLAGNSNDVLVASGLDIDVGGETGLDASTVGIEEYLDFVVLGAVAVVGVGEGNGADFAEEDFVGVGGCSDGGSLSDLDVSDGGFVDFGDHEHLGEVGDFEDDGAGVVHGSGHDDFADFGVEFGDDAVDGGGDGGVAEVIFGAGDVGGGGVEVMAHDKEVSAVGFEAFLGGSESGDEAIDFGLSGIDGGLADIAGCEELFLSFEVASGVGEVDLAGDDLGFGGFNSGFGDFDLSFLGGLSGLGLGELGFEVFAVEDNKDVVLFDGVALLFGEFGDSGGDAGADGDFLIGLDDTGSDDDFDKFAFECGFDADGSALGLGVGLFGVPPIASGGEGGEDGDRDDDGDDYLHSVTLVRTPDCTQRAVER